MNSRNRLSPTDFDQGKLEGLVIGKTDYRDHDAIVHIAIPEGIVSVLARGVQKESSRNRRLTIPYTKVAVNFDPRYSNDMLYLINGTVVESFWRCADSLESQCVCEILAALMERHGLNGTIFQALERVWSGFQNQDSRQALLYACFIAGEYLRLTGVEMNVDECTVCESTSRIAGVSIESGGFVCASHLGAHRRWPKKRLLQLRRILKTPFERLNELESFEWDLPFFIALLDWYVYFNDARLKSLEFLKLLEKDPEGAAEKF